MVIDMHNPDDPIDQIHKYCNSDDTSIVYLITYIPISNFQVLFLVGLNIICEKYEGDANAASPIMIIQTLVPCYMFSLMIIKDLQT